MDGDEGMSHTSQLIPFYPSAWSETFVTQSIQIGIWGTVIRQHLKAYGDEAV